MAVLSQYHRAGSALLPLLLTQVVYEGFLFSQAG